MRGQRQHCGEKKTAALKNESKEDDRDDAQHGALSRKKDSGAGEPCLEIAQVAMDRDIARLSSHAETSIGGVCFRNSYQQKSVHFSPAVRLSKKKKPRPPHKNSHHSPTVRGVKAVFSNDAASLRICCKSPQRRHVYFTGAGRRVPDVETFP